MPFKDAEMRRAYQRERARYRRAGDTASTPSSHLLPLDIRIRAAGDVLELLGEQVALVRAAEAGTLEKARTIGFLCGVALKAIEAKDLAGRLEALEQVLRARA
jgi:hypothetical protein